MSTVNPFMWQYHGNIFTGLTEGLESALFSTDKTYHWHCPCSKQLTDRKQHVNYSCFGQDTAPSTASILVRYLKGHSSVNYPSFGQVPDRTQHRISIPVLAQISVSYSTVKYYPGQRYCTVCPVLFWTLEGLV